MLRREHLVVALGLGSVAVLAWAWTLSGGGLPAGSHGAELMPEGMGTRAMTMAEWGPGHALLMFSMWWIMMVAMMVPSAAPFVLLATAIYRRKGPEARPAAMAALLTLGYLLAWGAFSVAATAGQWSLDAAGLLTGGGMAVGPILAGALLVGAGLYQLTPVKGACLRSCRSPIGFLSRHWRAGPGGALRMGLVHGGYCLGCCWFLMALLFVGGVMNPIWIGALALYVFLEKLAPGGARLGRAVGLLLVASGAWVWLEAAWIRPG